MKFRSAFITGASSGLGRGLALHYARNGAVVHAAARRAAELELLVAESAGASGRIVPVPLDVADSPALARAIRAAEEASGGALDLVVANAGLGYSTKPARLEWQKVAEECDVNVRAAFVTITAALPAMIQRGSGTVAGVSSLGALRPLAGNALYGATKVALAAFLEGVRLDLAGTGVRVLTIYPGYVKTPMTAKNKKPMPFLMDSDKAIEIMAHGIDSGHSRIAYPWQTNALMRVAQTLPEWLWTRVRG